jgi:hypothetical protein
MLRPPSAAEQAFLAEAATNTEPLVRIAARHGVEQFRGYRLVELYRVPRPAKPIRVVRPADLEAQVLALHAQRMSAERIGKRFTIDANRVCDILRANGVSVQRGPQPGFSPLPAEQAARVESLYLTGRLPARAISVLLGLTDGRVRAHLREAGIELRVYQPQQRNEPDPALLDALCERYRKGEPGSLPVFAQQAHIRPDRFRTALIERGIALRGRGRPLALDLSCADLH